MTTFVVVASPRAADALPIGTPTLIPADAPNANRLYEIGQVLFESERFAAAERHFSAAIRQQHDFTEAYFARARTRALLENYPLALQDFTAVLQADPTRADAYHQRGLTLLAMGNTGAALTDMNQAIEISASPIYLNDRGEIYVALEDLDAALEDFSLAIEVEPTMPEPYLNRARIYIANEETEAARNDLNRYLRIAPPNDPLYAVAVELLEGLSPAEE
jgi:tetratricopeptide (TPR) repeat protein